MESAKVYKFTGQQFLMDYMRETLEDGMECSEAEIWMDVQDSRGVRTQYKFNSKQIRKVIFVFRDGCEDEVENLEELF